jgi:hypothetical protein
MIQYEKTTAPCNRNWRNGHDCPARAGRDLVRHPDRAGLPPCAAASVCGSASLRTAGVCGAETDLPADRSRRAAGLLCAATGGLLWISSAPALPGPLSALQLVWGTAAPGERAAAYAVKRGIAKRGSETVRALYSAKIFVRKIRSSLQWLSNSATLQRSTRLCQHS